MIRPKKVTCLIILTAIILGAIVPEQTVSFAWSTASTNAQDDDETNDEKGLKFRLSEGAEQSESAPANNVPQAAPLSDADVQSVLKRLPAVKAEDSDEQDFAMRDKSLPPPRTGETIKGAFPPPVPSSLPDQVVSGPLEILRFSPDGEVPIAPQLSVTFSQPMVAMTSIDELARQNVPVRLMPQPPGRWRWVGTKTLLFEPDGRFPMATEYTVTVLAGTKSANGGTLANASSWKFATPPPQVTNMFPQSGPQRRDTLMFVEFDQKVDPASALRTIRVTAGGATITTRLATADEISSDSAISSLSKRAEAGRWLAFRAVDSNGNAANALPGDTTISVSVGPGTPSLEGPRVSVKAQVFSFKTFGPLRIAEHRCGYQEKCTPFDTWTITFSNSLDANSFQASQIRVEPAAPAVKASVYGNVIQLNGMKPGRTTYKVIVDGSLRDQFGQTLGTDQVVTFNVGSAPSVLSSSGGNFVVLDPAAAARYSVYSINYDSLKVRLYSVTPEDWEAFATYMRTARGNRNEKTAKEHTPPGRLVSNKIVPVAAKPDEMIETSIDLGPALKQGLGHVFVLIEPVEVKGSSVNVYAYSRNLVEAWVQSTNIGLDALVDNTDLVGWATSLKDGKPLGDVSMSIQPSGVKGQTGNDGIVRLALPPSAPKGQSLLVASRGGDVALLPEQSNYYHSTSNWFKKEIGDHLRWYVFDDRKMYKPGEEVHIKGWLRRISGGTAGDVGSLDGAVANVDYVVKDSRGNEVTKGRLSVNALGGFDTSFKLPDTMNLGYSQIELTAAGGSLAGNSHQHTFQVQEFRRPEFEVTAQTSEGPHFVGEFATSTVSASYYAGGALPNAEVNWSVTSTPGQFTPPNRSDFTFGKWIPWWISYNDRGDESHTETFAARTDASGKHNLRIDFDSVNPPRASNVTAEASVTDVNRQTWTASTSMLVHPADLYVGIRSQRNFVQKGEPIIVESIVADLDGKAIPNRDIKLRAVLLDWVYKSGQWKQEELNPQDCSIKSSVEAVKCTFTSSEGGTYRITASVMDDRERRNESEITVWVAGGKQPPKRDVEQEKVEMIPDRKDYQPRDTAEILIQAPFYPAEGVMTLRRSGIVRTERFSMDGPSYTLKIPIIESYLPNIHVQVDLNGAAARTDDTGQVDEKLPKRPAFATGTLNLSIPAITRKLSVMATPRDKALEPGGETVVNVEVKDFANRPVGGSEVVVVVVDESVLALTGYKLDDPLTVFYQQRGAETTDYYLRKSVLLTKPGDMNVDGVDANADLSAGGFVVARSRMMDSAMPSPQPKTARKKNGDSAESAPGESEAINVRENFNALAVFAASVPTDSNGRAEVKVKLPDNLTRYRVMAVSVAGGKQFGSGESAITARLPLMARPSAPRFLNFGDKFELPVVLQNQTDTPMTIDIAVRATNAELTAGSGRRVTVPANDRVEVRFPTSANKAGTARFQIAAVSGKWADAAEISLPVWTPATTEAFATYGEIDKGAISQAVKAPPDVFTQFGGLEISTSSTQLQELTDAVLYLTAYPYECSEQLASRIMGIAALKDVLTAFKAKDHPTPDAMKASVARDIERLKGMQNSDGGFGFWKRGDESWPYLSVHVAHALQRAKDKGFDVPKDMLENSRKYLRDIEKRIPSSYSLESRQAIIAYALNVRLRMKDSDPARARRLIAEAGLDKLSVEALGWLLPVLSDDPESVTQVTAIRRHLSNRATEEAGTAHFVTSYSDGAQVLLHSARRADGIILEALIQDQPQSDLIPKIVRGLLAHRTKGRWENTQENVFILLALDRYFATYEKVTPDFVARAWLGDRFAGEHAFKGRTTERFNVNVPMRYLAEKQGTQNLVLNKEGAGRLYYRLGMQYAPTSLKLASADYGFTVERKYEAVDHAEDVRRDTDGTWHIKAGAKVRVRLTMVAPTRRYHVALVDPLPAGLEVMNPALAVTGRIPADANDQSGKRPWWWWRQWYEHQNMRDERVEAFTSLLWEGVYDYSYVARATTPGAFVVPPTKAEEMYHPETFGRGASDRVVIE